MNPCMKPILSKDLRENFRLAQAGFGFLIFLLWIQWSQYNRLLDAVLNHRQSVLGHELQPLISETFLVPLAFFCALFGLVLGWVQARNEANRDLQAYLFHRPVTRHQIFLGKCLAGLVLYSLGAGLPLLGFFGGFILVPGHVPAPFAWGMLAPVLTVFISGLGFYSAGLLMGWRPARWFGSRVFGIAPAFFAMVVGVNYFSAPHPVLLVALCLIPLGLAIWGACVGLGHYQSQPVLARLGLIPVLAAGAGVVIFLAGVVLVDGIIHPLSPARHADYHQWIVSQDGQIYHELTHDDTAFQITNLQGQPFLSRADGAPIKKRNDIYRFVAPTHELNLNGRWAFPGSLDESARFFELCAVSDTALWYNVHGQLVGYDRQTRQCLGPLTLTDGDGHPTDDRILTHAQHYFEQFTYGSEDALKLLVSARSVYAIDFGQRVARAIFTPADHAPILGESGNVNSYDGHYADEFVATSNALTFLNYTASSEKPTLKCTTVPYVADVALYPSITWHALNESKDPRFPNTNSVVLEFTPNYRTNEASGWKMKAHFLWLTGAEQNTLTGTKENMPGVTQPMTCLAGHLTPTANLELPVYANHFTEYRFDQYLGSLFQPPFTLLKYDRHFAESFRHWNRWSTVSCLTATLWALLAWIPLRRYHVPARARLGWTLFIFATALPGYLALWCTYDRPARVACPACQKRRTVDRVHCEHCAAPFPPAEKNGTEIFAPLVKV